MRCFNGVNLAINMMLRRNKLLNLKEGVCPKCNKKVVCIPGDSNNLYEPDPPYDAHTHGPHALSLDSSGITHCLSFNKGGDRKPKKPQKADENVGSNLIVGNALDGLGNTDSVDYLSKKPLNLRVFKK